MLILPSNINIAVYIVIPGPGHVPRTWGTRCFIDVEVWIVYFTDERIFWCPRWAWRFLHWCLKCQSCGFLDVPAFRMCVSIYIQCISVIDTALPVSFGLYFEITWNHVCLFYMHYIINNVHVNILWMHCLTSHHLLYFLLVYKYSYLS